MLKKGTPASPATASVSDRAPASDYLDALREVPGLREAIDRACDGKALVSTWEENNRNLFAALRWQKISLAIVLSLVLGVGAFEVASALVVLVTEKRREFGILLALGGQPGLIRTTLLLAGARWACLGWPSAWRSAWRWAGCCRRESRL